ncbi:geranylgeranyl pyrophosphate synthase-like isoform X2 [Aricia agestis]|uniref:geranylgeranyl pyrophosphate synthase-like isoform X2 n=1 Tax=Aricia agestis TaxID=91739 RepID=UPI001C201D88|nr:geranylgeranyl pyrophosphate synthase-like isoform X2 [Aricia agestis]
MLSSVSQGFLTDFQKGGDDVQDGTQFRRNLPSAHRIYGTPWAANASTFCFMAALKKIADLGNPEAVDNFCQEMMSALDGIALDLYWRDAFICPTENEYMEMVKLKNSFFTLNLRIIQSFSKDRRTYSDLMNTYGVYYQIRDEYANLVNVKGLDTKSHEQEFKNLHEVMFCEDITEGRFTFPMIHGLNSSEGPTIRSILVQRTSDIRIKQHCLSLLEKVGSLDYTRRTLHDLDADLREQIHQLGGNPVFLAYLDELSNWK